MEEDKKASKPRNMQHTDRKHQKPTAFQHSTQTAYIRSGQWYFAQLTTSGIIYLTVHKSMYTFMARHQGINIFFLTFSRI